MAMRVNYATAASDGFKAMLGLENYCRSNVDQTLYHLVKLRASQVNGCAYCIDMHWIDARAAGESEARLYMLNAWRESSLYSEKERAALAWTESLTNVRDTQAPDEDFAVVRAQFNDKEIADLTLAVATINAWNRLSIGFRAEPGHYRPAGAFAGKAH